MRVCVYILASFDFVAIQAVDQTHAYNYEKTKDNDDMVDLEVGFNHISVSAT